MNAAPVIRRFLLAGVALAIAAVLFRANVASALVTRGDDGLRAGALDDAIAHYERATRFDPRSVVAADRLAFALLSRRARGDAARALAATDRALRRAPRSAALLDDRGFAEEQLGRWAEAERDFAAGARFAHDPRFAHLAAQMARRAGARDRLRMHLREALAIDDGYLPAQVLLTRLGR